MKRLIKKSEIYDGFNFKSQYIECFKNPTFKEIEEIRNVDPHHAIRGVIDEGNILYIWPAEISHYSINQYINVPVNYFRFVYEPTDLEPWLFDLTGLGGELMLDGAVSVIKNNQNILQQIGDLNMPFAIMSKSKYTHGKNLNEWLNEYTLEKELVVAKLIKKSEIYDGFSSGDEEDSIYYEIFKNPTDSEIKNIKNSNEFNSIRGLIYNDGTVYIWSGEILHYYLYRYNINLDINQFRFSFDGKWLFDTDKRYSIKETKDLIIKYKDILSRMGDLNTPIEIGYTSDKNDNHFKFKNFNELENFNDFENVANKKSKLIKKAEPVDGFYDEDKVDKVWYTVYKNPTSSEIEDVKKTKSVRGVIYNDGTMYIWPGNILHDSINKTVKEININVDDSFRFCWEMGGWLIDANRKFSVIQSFEQILKYQDKLQQIGDINTLFQIFYTTGRNHAALEFNQIQSYLDGVKNIPQEELSEIF